MGTIDSPLVYDAPRARRGLPTRGLVMAAVVVGLGACLVRPSSPGVPWADLSVLATMAVAAILGGNEARRMSLARSDEVPSADPVAGGWMTVVVESQGPADTAGIVGRPKAPPRDDPERRSLRRRADERRRAVPARR